MSTFLYLLIGIVITYFMQNDVRSMAEHTSEYKNVQKNLRILYSVFMAATWPVTAPSFYIALRWKPK